MAQSLPRNLTDRRSSRGRGASDVGRRPPRWPARSPLGRRIELPGRGTDLRARGARAPRRSHRGAAARPGRQRRPELVPGLRAAWASTSTWWPPTSGATGGACAPASGSGWPTAPTTSPPCSTSSASPAAIAVGYSMGGPVAQLLWKRHREQVDGLVLCATSDRFVPGRPATPRLRHRHVGGGRQHPSRPGGDQGPRAAGCATGCPPVCGTGPTASGRGPRRRCAATTGGW